MRGAFAAPLSIPSLPLHHHTLLRRMWAARRIPLRARLARVTTQYLPTSLSRVPPLTQRTAAFIAHLVRLGVSESRTRAALHSLRSLSALQSPNSSTALLPLLSTAGFEQVTSFPRLDPPDGSSISVRVRTGSNCLDPNADEAAARNDFAPVYIAVRGLTFERRTGLLLRSKLRALENAYLEPLSLPSAFLRRALRGLSATLPSATVSSDAPVRPSLSTHARRVVPAGDPRDLFQPVVAQEPAYSFVAAVYPSRRGRHWCIWNVAHLRDVVSQVIRRAVDPANSTLQTPRVSSPPPAQHIVLYRNVPWGLLPHTLPSDVQTVLPRVGDLLRVDLLTLLGLGSALVTYVRDTNSPFLQLALAGTVVAYTAKIVFSLRSALVGYQRQVAMDKLERVVATGDAARAVVGEMAAEKRFVLLACVWAEMAVNGSVAGLELRKSVFKEDAPIASEEWAWARTVVREWAGVKVGSESGGATTDL